MSPELAEALESGRFVTVREGGMQLRCTVCRTLGHAWGKWYEDHQQEHNYPCDDCGVSFLSQRALNTHLQKAKVHQASA